MKYNQKLPKKVEKQLDDYIARIKAIKWFQPASNIKKAEVEKQVKLVLETFGVKAKLEFRQLKTANDWDAARDAAQYAARDAAWGSAWDAARDAAWGSAWDAARDAAWYAAWYAAWGSARDAAWGSAWDAARDAARGSADVLALNLKDYKKKYPKGNFINLISLWEIGLYPIGVIDGKFIIYVPASKSEKDKKIKYDWDLARFKKNPVILNSGRNIFNNSEKDNNK